MGREEDRREERRSRRHRHSDDDYSDDKDHRRRRKRKDKKRRDSKHGDASEEESADGRHDHRHRHRKESRRHERDEEDSSDSRRHSRHRDSKKSRDRHERKRKSERKDEDRHHRSKSKKSKKESERRGHKEKATSSHGRDKASLFPMGDPVGKPPSSQINPDRDYFAFHQQFWVYLFREEGISFNDLTSEQTHEAFKRFTKVYNSGRLEAPYYDGSTFPPQVLEESRTTQHKWSFQTSETERRGLEALQQGVRKLTEYNKEDPNATKDEVLQAKRSESAAASNRKESEAALPPLDRRKTADERLEERRANRRLRNHVRNAEEEVSGGAKDFRERQIEQRQEQAARQHGAAKDKEASRAGMELSDADLYGESTSSFQAALNRQKQFKARKEDQKAKRVEELNQKERNRQENMLKLLGLDAVQPGQKITIAPRKD